MASYEKINKRRTNNLGSAVKSSGNPKKNAPSKSTVQKAATSANKSIKRKDTGKLGSAVKSAASSGTKTRTSKPLTTASKQSINQKNRSKLEYSIKKGR